MPSIIPFLSTVRDALSHAIPRSTVGIAVTLTILVGAGNLARDADLEAGLSGLHAHAVVADEWSGR